MSVERSVPTTSAARSSPPGRTTVTESAAPTTCSFVITWPSPSITKPEPVASPPGAKPLADVVARTRTTPALVRR